MKLFHRKFYFSKCPLSRYIFKNVGFIPVTVVIILLMNCSDPTGNGDNDNLFIPTTEARGPGGPAYIAGCIRDYLYGDQPVTNTKLFVMDQNDYSDTLVHIFINSTDASFNILEMPLDTVDLIFTNHSFFSRKVPGLCLKQNENSFYNPWSLGYFADSTLFMISIADSFVDGKTNIGYGPGVFAQFKVRVPDSISFSIIQASGCDTLHVYHNNDPVFDLTSGDIYDLLCKNISAVYGKVDYFIWFQEIFSTNPWIIENFVH